MQFREFTDILLKMALIEVTENLIRDGREERLKQPGAACFTCGPGRKHKFGGQSV